MSFTSLSKNLAIIPKSMFWIFVRGMIAFLIWSFILYFLAQASSAYFLYLKKQGTLSADWYPLVAKHGLEFFIFVIGVWCWAYFVGKWREEGAWSWDRFFIVLIMGIFMPTVTLTFSNYLNSSFPWNLFNGLVVISMTGVPALFISQSSFLMKKDGNLLRGTQVVPSGKTEACFEKLLKNDLVEAKRMGFQDKPGITFWQHSHIPYSKENQHLLITGSPGSGKTQILYPIIEQVIARGDRVIIWDVKGTYTQAFYGTPGVSLLAPWDRRSIAWRPGADILKPEDCHQVASIMIPENTNETQPYFTTAARNLLEAILMHLDASGDAWGWRDVYQLIQSGPEELAATLSKTSFGHSVAQTYFGAKSGSDVYATLRAKTSIVYWLAKAWPKEGVSLRNWIRGQGSQVLILGGVPEREKLASETANLALHILVKQLLSLPDDLNRRVWFFLDEIASLGRVSVIQDLGAMGRSKGGCLVAGIQDLGKMEHLYGRELTKSLANVFSTMIFLRSTDVATSGWASEVIGDQEVIEFQKGTSKGFHDSRSGWLNSNSGSSDSQSMQEVVRQKRTFLSSQIAQFKDLEGLFRGSSWPVAHLVWSRNPIPQKAALVEEAAWVQEKEAFTPPQINKSSKWPGPQESSESNDGWGHIQ